MWVFLARSPASRVDSGVALPVDANGSDAKRGLERCS
jgi:hypothetical protein